MKNRIVDKEIELEALTMSIVVRASLRSKLFSYGSIILLKGYLFGNGLVPKLGGKARPLLKFGNGHFLFHISGVVRLICPVIGLPYGIGFTFVIVAFSGANIAASFVRFVQQWGVTVAVVLSSTDQKESAASLTLVAEAALIDSIEEVKE